MDADKVTRIMREIPEDIIAEALKNVADESVREAANDVRHAARVIERSVISIADDDVLVALGEPLEQLLKATNALRGRMSDRAALRSAFPVPQ